CVPVGFLFLIDIAYDPYRTKLQAAGPKR
ncbi:hypothetical protein GWI33_009888, partial [Rhynchophorus ferrugineus]